jgi:hypothetical protein
MCRLYFKTLDMADTGKKIANVINLSAEDRYDYFIRKVADFEEVWGLFDNGWAMLGHVDEKTLALWPEKAFAEICINTVWKTYRPKKILLNDFLQKWLPGMDSDGTKAAVFFTPKEKGIIVPSKKLLANLNDELQQYE